MAEKRKALRFEDRLEQLEKLTEKMEEGSLGLEELLDLYEKGVALSNGLQKELEQAQARLLELKAGKLTQMEEE